MPPRPHLLHCLLCHYYALCHVVATRHYRTNDPARKLLKNLQMTKIQYQAQRIRTRHRRNQCRHQKDSTSPGPMCPSLQERTKMQPGQGHKQQLGHDISKWDIKSTSSQDKMEAHTRSHKDAVLALTTKGPARPCVAAACLAPA